MERPQGGVVAIRPQDIPGQLRTAQGQVKVTHIPQSVHISTVGPLADIIRQGLPEFGKVNYRHGIMQGLVRLADLRAGSCNQSRLAPGQFPGLVLILRCRPLCRLQIAAVCRQGGRNGGLIAGKFAVDVAKNFLNVFVHCKAPFSFILD